MGYSFLSRFKVKSDREAEFVALAQEMEAHIHLEPGTVGFKFFRLEAPGMFAVYESFVDVAAGEAHMETAHGKPLIERMLVCIEGGYEREFLHDLAGGR